MPTTIQIKGDVPTQAIVSSHENRDSILKFSALVTEVKSEGQLETAVKTLKELNGILKETDAARKTEKAPVIALGKVIDNIADEFKSPVEKEKDRLSGLVNHFTKLQLREKQEHEAQALLAQRAAEEQARKAQEAIDAAARKIEEAKTAKDRAAAQKAQLAAELAQETANLNIQAAQDQLSLPTNTPKGLVIKTRWNFQIVTPDTFRTQAPGWCFTFHADTEAYKIDRTGILKALNAESGHSWLPQTGETITHANIGIRIFTETKGSVRS